MYLHLISNDDLGDCKIFTSINGMTPENHELANFLLKIGERHAQQMNREIAEYLNTKH